MCNYISATGCRGPGSRPGGSGLGDCIISPPGPSGRGVRRCGVGCGWAGYVWGSLFVCAVWVGFFGAAVGGTAVGVSCSARGRSVVFARGALGVGSRMGGRLWSVSKVEGL